MTMQRLHDNLLLDLTLGGHRLTLLNKAILLGNKLVLADPHFGKTAHFRKAGLPIPPHAREKDYQRLTELIVTHTPPEVIILGDLFHSEYNEEWMEFERLMNCFNRVAFTLVKGNHDIIPDDYYKKAGLNFTDSIQTDGLLLTHEPAEQLPPGTLNVHGHIHPGIRLDGRGKQSVSVPCFHLGPAHFCLPAFGNLTGLSLCRPGKGDSVYAIVDDQVIDVSNL